MGYYHECVWVFLTEFPSYNKTVGRYYIMNDFIAHPNYQI